MELDFACRYPFTEEGKQAILENDIQINEEIAERAVQRVLNAMNWRDKEGRAIYDPTYAHLSDKHTEIGSYGAARMMLAHLRNRYLTNSFAVGEAKKVYAHLTSGKAEEGEITKLQEEFGVRPGRLENRDTLPLATYVTFSPRSIDYRLANRNVKNGQVEIKKRGEGVSKREDLRLLQEAIKIRVEQVGTIKNAPELIRKNSGQLMKALPKVAPSKMSFEKGDNPPCIEKLLEAARLHQNLGHQGRWSLAVYLINKGVPYEKILGIFSNFPDYDERIASYQIKHAINRGYSMPACSMMLSYGLCVANCRVKSPLGWDEWKKRKRS
jgi:DNA primase large subunit